MTEGSALAAESDKLLQPVPLFEQMPANVRLRLASYARERLFVAGELVFQEGDPGDEFYLIAAGAVHIVGRASDSSALMIAKLTEGRIFGEQALLEGGPRVRNASARAAERSRLLAFPREALLEALRSDRMLDTRLRDIGEIQAVERRQLLREKILEEVGSVPLYEIQRFEKGRIIFSEGDLPGNVYLILSGNARVTRGQGAHAAVLAELLPGQFFGERAILHDAPRAATVEATSELEVAALDGAGFRAALAAQPRLRSIMASLQAIYLLPARGLVTLQGGNLGPHPTLTATYRLPGGQCVFSTRVTDLDAFSARVIGAPEANRSVRFTAHDDGILREIHLCSDQIVEIESEGAWQQLGHVFECLLDGSRIQAAELAAFEAGGDLDARVKVESHAEFVCRCARVSAASLVSMIAAGCNSIEKVAARSMATMVCGGCVPAIKEFLGQGEWMPVACTHNETVAPGIRSFQLRVLTSDSESADLIPHVPGQHLILQARMGGHWIERPYTISSAPGTPGSYEIIVKREPDGLLSRWLFDSLDAGTPLRISRPRGCYHLDPDHCCDVVFLAGGIGITPALAMARTYAHASQDWRLHIDHSVPFVEHSICEPELRMLAGQSAHLTFQLRVTRRDGRINLADARELKEKYAGGLFYLCGSSGYVEAVKGLLMQAGVADSRVRIELFSVRG